jgi:quercetin dioxygenase-like cupin family protein
VLYVVIAGAATLRLDGVATELHTGEALIVDKGIRRALSAGPDGVRYLTAHVRRGPLQLRKR